MGATCGTAVPGERFFGTNRGDCGFWVVRFVVSHGHEATKPFGSSWPFFGNIDEGVRYEIDGVSWTVIVLINSAGAFKGDGVVEEIVPKERPGFA
jgi:hypothetical protein